MEIDENNKRMSENSIPNVYEDINYNELALHENYDDIMQSNTYVEMQDRNNETICKV